MTIVIHYTPRNYHPLARAAHDRLVPQARRIDVSGDSGAYWRSLVTLWAEKQDILNIEQDVEPNRQALREAACCPRLWCVSPYRGPGLDEMFGTLGFVRWRKELMEEFPEAMAEAGDIRDSNLTPGDWRRVDAWVNHVILNRIGEPHVHHRVLHHHLYHGRCACMKHHAEYPMDREGRYSDPSFPPTYP